MRKNLLIFTADSLRFDSYEQANIPYLKSKGKVKKAYAQATYTFPAHISLMLGFLPHCFSDDKLYNRYRQQLIRLGIGKGTGGGNYQEGPMFEVGFEDYISTGFEKLDYLTLGTGAVSWFKHNIWRTIFQKFKHINNASSQTKWFSDCLKNNKNNFFGLINFGETHEPYSYGKVKNNMPDGYQIHKLGFGPLKKKDFRQLHLHQIKALEYLDDKIHEVCKNLTGETVVVFTADHGECFGEDGFFGHGFYHEKVMEVPLLIFEVRNT